VAEAGGRGRGKRDKIRGREKREEQQTEKKITKCICNFLVLNSS